MPLMHDRKFSKESKARKKGKKKKKKRKEETNGHGHPEARLMPVGVSFIGMNKKKKSVCVNSTPPCMLVLFR